MAFCFECPLTTTDQNAGDGKYDKIINIVNPNDFVTKVPLAKWGFKRYGKTYSIPCRETNSEYISSYYLFMEAKYKEIFYKNGIKGRSCYNELQGQASLLDEYFDYLGTLINRNDYAAIYQDDAIDIASSCLGGQGDPNWLAAIPELSTLLPVAAVRPVSTMIIKNGFTVCTPAPMPSAHYPELCLSWINSIPDFDGFTPKAYRIVLVKCPVDITVRDSRGNVVGQIENDEVAEIENGIAARIDEDGRKIFILPEDEEYTVDIKATDSGKVNYTIKEYNFESQTTEMAVIYKDVEVSAGDELIAKVAEAPEGNEADYTLQHAEDMEEITADEVLTGDDIIEYTVAVESNGNGTVTGGGSYVKGELATVTATVDAGNSFEGWYLGDSCVSKEELYRFTVEADTVLKAVFSSVDNSISIENTVITGIGNKTYTGKEAVQNIIIKYNDTVLSKDTDYTVSYKNNINAGTASVIITGKGNYTGSVTKTFTINKAVNKITAKNFIKTYSTKAQSFWTGVKVADGVRTFKSNSKSVTVSKSGKVTIKAKFIGKATITITAPETKNYKKTTKKITITVNPTKTALSSVTSPSAGKMTVKWKKNAVGTGYQIQYSTSSKFTSPKAVSVTKNSTLTKTIGGLTKGKKYYVRIRTYKTVGKTKFYSAWSAAKTVTIKK